MAPAVDKHISNCALLQRSNSWICVLKYYWNILKSRWYFDDILVSNSRANPLPPVAELTFIYLICLSWREDNGEVFDSPAQSLRTMEKWKLWFRIDQISLSDWDDWVIERLRCLYRDSQSDHYQPDHVSSSLSTELKIKTKFKSKVTF